MDEISVISGAAVGRNRAVAPITPEAISCTR
jgi:hypothetical protein